MSFTTFQVTELDADAENDYQIDIVDGNSRHGFCVKEAELRMLSDAFDDALDDSPGVIDGRTVEEYEEADA